MANQFAYTHTGVGSYEWECGTDVYTSVSTIVAGTVSYLVEVSVDGTNWHAHPGPTLPQPASTLNVCTMKGCVKKMRVRNESGSGSITISYVGGQLGRN